MSGGELTRGDDIATDAALSMAALVANPSVVRPEMVRDLHRLLKHEIAAPSTARERFEQLGLLMELLYDGSGEFPSMPKYGDARASRKHEGWPDASTLSRSYGTWAQAVRAAARFLFIGGSARVAANHSHVRKTGEPAPYAPYATEDILRAIERFFIEHSVWPTKWEYEDWAHLCRTIERDDPRLPTMGVICGRQGRSGAFDCFEDAVYAAQRRHVRSAS